MCCSSAEPRPSWVIDALADCSKCQAGELCEFMDNLRAREQPIGQGGADEVEGIESDDSSLWEGEGTSDSLSSVAPTEPATVPSLPSHPSATVSKPCRRLKGKQKHSRSEGPLATGAERGEGPLATGSGCKGPLDTGAKSVQKLKVLLIGDSNASGCCETHPFDSSLRKALSAHYDITVAARSSTS